jgi:hypothetical protein
MPQTLKLNNKKWKKSSFYEGKSLVGLTPDFNFLSYFVIFFKVEPEDFAVGEITLDSNPKLCVDAGKSNRESEG